MGRSPLTYGIWHSLQVDSGITEELDIKYWCPENCKTHVGTDTTLLASVETTSQHDSFGDLV